MIRNLVLPLLLILPLGPVWAGAASSEKPVPLDRLLERLGSDLLPERTQAQETLSRMSGDIEPRLRVFLGRKDLELEKRIRIKNVLKTRYRLDRLRPYDRPRRIDLTLKDTPLREALETLHRRFGWTVACEPAVAERKVSANLKGVRFFEAVEALRLRTKLIYRQPKSWPADTLVDHPRDKRIENPKAHVIPVILANGGTKAKMPAQAVGPFLIYLPFGPRFFKDRWRDEPQIKLVCVSEPDLSMGGFVVEGKHFNQDGKFVKNSSLSPAENHWHADPWAAYCLSLGNGFGMWEKFKAGSYRWDLQLQVRIPLRTEKRVVRLEDENKHRIEVPGGWFQIDRRYKNGKTWYLDISYDEGGRRIFDAPETDLLDVRIHGIQGLGIREDRPGVYILDEEGKWLSAHSTSGRAATEKRKATLIHGFSGKPHTVIVQWNSKIETRRYKLSFKDLVYK